jgi:hypothetical protein
MNELKTILENIFYSQENNTITLSFSGAKIDDDKDIYDTMERIKIVLSSIGVDNVSFTPDALSMTVVTTDDKFDEVAQIAKDFGASVTSGGSK